MQKPKLFGTQVFEKDDSFRSGVLANSRATMSQKIGAFRGNKWYSL